MSDIVKLITSLSVKEAQLSFPQGTISLLNYYQLIIPAFSQIKNLLHETIRLFQQSAVKVNVEAIPPCLLGGYEKCSTDYIKAKYPNFIYELPRNGMKEEIYSFEFKMGKVYTKKCLQCDYLSVCAGVYVEYLANYGDYDFEPVEIKK